jgi:hypothetical protein
MSEARKESSGGIITGLVMWTTLYVAVMSVFLVMAWEDECSRARLWNIEHPDARIEVPGRPLAAFLMDDDAVKRIRGEKP